MERQEWARLLKATVHKATVRCAVESHVDFDINLITSNSIRVSVVSNTQIRFWAI